MAEISNLQEHRINNTETYDSILKFSIPYAKISKLVPDHPEFPGCIPDMQSAAFRTIESQTEPGGSAGSLR